jgi:4'-phosphopantetheinyl transferase EntD
VGSGGTLLGRVLPDAVAVAERTDDPPEAEAGMFDAEREAVARAVPRRQAEYRTVRYCAREALGRLGFGPVPILSGPKREPLWPDGVVGSLTHCAGFRGAAVARAGSVLGVGVDAEPHLALPEGVLERVAEHPGERAGLAALSGRDPDVHWDRVLFCAKEAVYKVWYPLARRWLGFEDAWMTLAPDGGFHARLLVPGPIVQGRELTALDGRWVVADGLILAAVTLLPG